MTDTLTIYNQVKQQYSYMPDLIPGQLQQAQVQKIQPDEHDKLEQAIIEFGAESGWLCYQSKLVRYDKNDSLSSAEHGWILQGELSNASQSCHIRQSAEGGWLVTLITDVSAEQQSGFIQAVSFLAVPENEGDKEQRLNYQVYWEPDEALGYRQVLSRFTGFSDEEQE